MATAELDPRYPRLISPGSLEFEIGHVADARSEPPVRGERLLRGLEMLFIRLNAATGRAVPEHLNPFAQMGAVANTTFFIALATGILLLFWYSPSVNHAYDSVVGLQNDSFLGGLMRSLHRYSSDACMLFVLLHGFQTFFARKIGGARWLAWMSGVLLIGLLWFDGWTGYWLVWDERAQLVATGTAKMIDVLPLFTDPLSRSFLTNESVNSLFFFIIFFIHMLIPLAMGIALWLHIMRLHKSKFLTGRTMSVIITVALIVLSLAVPADFASRADMAATPQDLSVDWYYLLPLFATDRLTGAALWVGVLLATVVVFGLPWIVPRRRAAAAIVDEVACNGCTQCFQDCPYNAVSLLPREDDRGENPVFARIDAAKCVGCGICVGSCDSSGIDQARLPLLDIRKWVNRNARDPETGEGQFVAFVCAESGGADLGIDAIGQSTDLTGYRIVPVPCAGWVHMLTVERAIRHGAKGVLIVGCGSDPSCRHGALWTHERVNGDRGPALRSDMVPDGAVRYVRYDRSDRRAFLRAATAFQKGRPDSDRPRVRNTFRRYVGAAVLLLGIALPTVALSDLRYPMPVVDHAELVVSFKHAGQLVEHAAQSDDEDLLPHMRGAPSGRKTRVPVRMTVVIDGEQILRRTYEPSGLFNDGTSIAIEPIKLAPGEHRVHVFIGDSSDASEWRYETEETIDFAKGRRRVVQFEQPGGFRWK